MLGLSFAHSVDRQPSTDPKITFIEETHFCTCTVLEDNNFDTFTVSPWNIHPFISPLSNNREIKLGVDVGVGVGVGKGCAPQQTLFWI